MLIHVFAFFSSVWSLLLLCDSDSMVWEKRNYDPPMYQLVFRPLLLGYIGQYIKDIPIYQLKIDIWKGILSCSPFYIYFYINLYFKLFGFSCGQSNITFSQTCWHLGCLGNHNCEMNSCNFLSPFGSLLQFAFIGIKICCLTPSVTPTLSCIDFSLFNFLLHILTPSFGALLWYVFIVHYYQVSENSANYEIPFVYSCFFWVYSCITWKNIVI